MSSGILQKYPLSTAKNLATTELLPSYHKVAKRHKKSAPGSLQGRLLFLLFLLFLLLLLIVFIGRLLLRGQFDLR